MTRKATASLLPVVVVCFWGSFIFAGDSTAEGEKDPALKYHAVLQKRPEPGYLFDRFYNAWLDQSTAESLQVFLQQQVEQADTTANRFLLAFFHSKQNNDVGAIEELTKALKDEPANAAAWYYKAQAEARSLEFETAIADLKQAQQQKPSAKLSVAIERQLGTMLLRNRQTEEAIQVWKTLLAAYPDDEELCEDIIDLHIEEGLFEQAAALSEALIARTKDPYLAVTRRLRLGDIHHRSGQRHKAVEVYASTLREAGHDTWLEREILAQIEQLFRLEDDLSGLKAKYMALVEADPKRIGLQRRRCRLLADLGEQDEAIKGYRTILELTPGDRGNREEYVDMLSRIGRHELAVKELESLCEQNPKDAELQVRLAKTLQLAKEPAKAVEAVKQYLKISDGSEYAYLRAARLVDTFGDKENAKTFYRTMTEAFPEKEYDKAAEKLKELKPAESKAPDQQRRDLARLKATAQRMAAAAQMARPARSGKPATGKQSENGRPSDKQGQGTGASGNNSSNKSGGEPGNSSEGGLSESIGELAEAIEACEKSECDKKSLCEKVDKLAEQLKKLGICRRCECRLSKLCRKCGSCQSSMCCESPNAGGHKAGWGTNTARRDDRDEVVDNGQTTQLQGQKGSGPSVTAVESADSGSGVSTRRGTARERAFKHQFESFVQREDVPEAVRDGVKQYFEIIHETDTGTSPKEDSKE